ncbi:TetR/AcrR family transcriptional regulator [Streptacidiphilus sp. PB12-B1b]|uniref:TetR/AcrR family transcriptional regulator n=1 Tax=Streptacidiphilus sp. PB12-B1b TaxID=2705012 RepID=UPI0015F84DEB|nr:TetR/AcrR family transcriptional regulator [Streptacidiphilus sp. PB12-B1b]QMU77995.1 TetR/AcrR family transcriptional regulator [Streptacidiphilus sp. PB12-B1b]
MATTTTPAAESLRERKKRMTRQAIFAAAQRLFGERGFDAVTVAEIADAANISVKTLFTYVRSKEELVFADGPTVLDAVVEAVRDRDPATSPLDAVARTLLDEIADGQDPPCLEGLHRLLGAGPAVRSRLRRMWEETEDALTEALADDADDAAARAGHRLTAAQLMILVRGVTSQEVRALISPHRTAGAQRRALDGWIRTAAGRLARGLPATPASEPG